MSAVPERARLASIRTPALNNADVIAARLASENWERRLAEARAKRAEALANRARAASDRGRAFEPVSGSAPGADAGHASKAILALIAPAPPMPRWGRKARRDALAAVGLALVVAAVTSLPWIAAHVRNEPGPASSDPTASVPAAAAPPVSDTAASDTAVSAPTVASDPGAAPMPSAEDGWNGDGGRAVASLPEVPTVPSAPRVVLPPAVTAAGGTPVIAWVPPTAPPGAEGNATSAIPLRTARLAPTVAPSTPPGIDTAVVDDPPQISPAPTRPAPATSNVAPSVPAVAEDGDTSAILVRDVASALTIAPIAPPSVGTAIVADPPQASTPPMRPAPMTSSVMPSAPTGAQDGDGKPILTRDVAPAPTVQRLAQQSAGAAVIAGSPQVSAPPMRPTAMTSEIALSGPTVADDTDARATSMRDAPPAAALSSVVSPPPEPAVAQRPPQVAPPSIVTAGSATPVIAGTPPPPPTGAEGADNSPIPVRNAASALAIPSLIPRGANPGGDVDPPRVSGSPTRPAPMTAGAVPSGPTIAELSDGELTFLRGSAKAPVISALTPQRADTAVVTGSPQVPVPPTRPIAMTSSPAPAAPTVPGRSAAPVEGIPSQPRMIVLSAPTERAPPTVPRMSEPPPVPLPTPRPFDGLSVTVKGGGSDVVDLVRAGGGVVTAAPVALRPATVTVRYFHDKDAVAADDLAARLGTTASDYGSFRPRPPAGHVEVLMP